MDKVSGADQLGDIEREGRRLAKLVLEEAADEQSIKFMMGFLGRTLGGLAKNDRDALHGAWAYDRDIAEGKVPSGTRG